MKDLALLYVGALTPDGSARTNAAVSAAGEIFQRNFLDGLSASGLPRPEVVSYAPVPSYPAAPLWVAGRAGRFGEDLAGRVLPHLNLGPLKILALGLSASWQTARWALKNRGRRKVALLYNLNAPPAAALLPVCRAFGIKLVPFVGDIYVPGEVVDGGPFRRLEFWLQTRTVPKVDGLLVCNRAIVEDLAPGREALLVEGGVPLAFVDRFSPPRARTEEGFRVVFAGSLTRLNGVLDLLGALKELDDPDLRVAIVGRGEEEEAVRRAAAEDSRIDFRGLVPHAEVMALYEEADLLLSLRETGSRTERYVFPSKVVECMATGRPLLTTATGHVRSDFGNVVYLLDELAPTALANRLREIKAAPASERAALGRRAQRLVRETRTWDVHARRIERYVREVVLKEPA